MTRSCRSYITYDAPPFSRLIWDFIDEHTIIHRYGIVCLDIGDYDAATFVRRFLKHPRFDTEAKRLNAVIRLSYVGLPFWQMGIDSEQRLNWG